jgi:hypothetical protein
MAGRLLAYGGTSFSERRRIGQWPAVPEATLRDSYGLQTNAWVYGLGVLAKQPFLILRQRQNIESRGGYPFSLLLDPPEAVWQNFSWNAAALIAALLELNPDLLFRSPENCSADALESLLSSLPAQPVSGALSPFALATAAMVTASDPVALSPSSLGFSERPDAATTASALAALPVCFRASCGWLVGGGSAHGRAFGASLVVDDQATGDAQAYIESGRKLTAAWTSARALLNGLDARPMWLWADNPTSTLDAALLLQDLQSAESITDELIDRAEKSQALNEPIDQLITDRLTVGSAPLGPKASAMLIARCLNSKAKCKVDEATAARLDRRTVLAELRRWGSPPKKIPRSLPVPQDWRVEMWVDYLQRLTADVRKSLAEALEQVGPYQELIEAALVALPASEEKLTDWGRFRDDEDLWPQLQPALRDEALRRFQRNVKGAEEAYLQLADDPDGDYARSVLPRAEFYRLMPNQRPASAAPRAVESKPASSALREDLDSVLFESDRDNADRKAESLRLKYEKAPGAAKSALDAMIETRCDTRGPQFAESFSGKYQALGDVLGFLSNSAQDRLLEVLREYQGSKFQQQAAIDLAHALKNKPSRNAYSSALSRYLLADAPLRRQVARVMVEDDLERKLKSMLSQKDGRG